jgi:hypothetical protein
MPHAAIKQHDLSEDHAISVRPSGTEVLQETKESDARGQLHVVQNSTPGLYPAAQPEIVRSSAGLNLAGDGQTMVHRLEPHSPGHDRLMNARQVAENWAFQNAGGETIPLDDLRISERLEPDYSFDHACNC